MIALCAALAVLQLQSARAAVPVVLDYTFEDGTPGQAGLLFHDSSTNHQNASPVVGTVNYVATPPGGQGSVSVNFTGQNTIGVGDIPAFALTNQFTLEAAFRPATNNPSNDRVIIQRVNQGINGSTYELVFLGGSNQVLMHITDPTLAYAGVAAPFPMDGRSHHCAGVYSNHFMALYVDGVLQATNTTTLTPAGPALGIYFGGNNSGGFAFSGIVDRIRISAAALTPGDFFQNSTVVDYTFEDGTPGQPVTRVHDSSGNNLDATLIVGAPGYVATPADGLGAVSVHFNGGLVTGDAFGVPDVPSLALTNQFTLEAEFLPATDNPANDRVIIQRVNAFGNGISYDLVFKGTGNLVQMHISDATLNSSEVSAPFPIDGFSHHCAGVYSNHVMSIYVDGVLQAATNTALTPNGAPGQGVFFGANNSGGYAFDGTLDRVRISGTALTPGQFFAYPVAVNNTVIDLSFQGGVPGHPLTVVPDSSGNNLNATVTSGAPAYVATPPGGIGTVSASFAGGIGAGDAISVPENPSFVLTNQFTLEAEFRPGANNPANGRILIQHINQAENGASYDFGFIGVVNQVHLDVTDSSGNTVTVSAPFPMDGLSHHCAGVYSNHFMAIYVDAVLLAATNAAPTPSGAPGSGLFFGANDVGGFAFGGIIDRIRISNTALSPQQFFIFPITSADRIPDSWRLTYFGAGFATDPRALAAADPDGDGVPNYLEYVNGTSPLNAASPFIITNIRLAPLLTFNTQPNSVYQVLRSESVTTTNWVPISPPITATGNSTTFADATATNAVYIYRLQLIGP